MLTLRTLCSSGELFGVGARAAGWQHVDGWELDPKRAAIANQNGFDVRAADICLVDWSVLPAVDHLHASPSCKSASQANNQQGETEGDKQLADAIARAIRAHQGRSFSLENVWFYRNYDSFARILAALYESGFVVDYRHLNAADFGVPQTRKRLILRAVRRSWRDSVPPLCPTHRRGGDMFHAPWVGWLSAIADILHTLPPTQPAPWQRQRLARLATTTLIGAGGWDGGVVQRAADAPAFTLAHGGDPNSTGNSAQIRAYLVGGGNTNLANPTSLPRANDEPAFTVRVGGNGSPERALLLGDQSASQGQGVIRRRGDAPAMTLRGSHTGLPRAYVGRWVAMTVQALGRFQTVPDDYIGLTAAINGDGVPCLLARRVMESLQ